MTAHLHGLRLPPRRLGGLLDLPEHPRGLVVFVHGSGSSRFGTRHGFVARSVERAGIATLLFDLLTPEEARDCRKLFDIALLAERLRDVIRCARTDLRTDRLSFGLHGAGTGAAAALVAVAEAPEEVEAVVSRGGRPDLAGGAGASHLAAGRPATGSIRGRAPLTPPGNT